MFLVLLAGVSDHSPLNKIYFLQAATGNIPHAPTQSRWTYWNLCSATNGKNDCGKVRPAFPFDPPSGRNFDTSMNVPDAFIGTRKYYYLTRFMFAFALIALFWAVCSLFTGLLALCSRIGSYLSGLLVMFALFFQTLTAALMTYVFLSWSFLASANQERRAAYVLGRDKFRKNNQSAQIGKEAFGFMWAAVACLFLSTLLFCLAGASGRKDTTRSTGSNKRGGMPFFGGRAAKRSQSTRSTRSARSGGRERGSFLDAVNANGQNKEFV